MTSTKISANTSMQSMPQLFEKQVTRTPNAIAAVYENKQLTYAELNAKANQIAHYLQALGVAPETLVGIHLERSLDILVAILGILKAGGAYVPLDPEYEYPTERLAFMVRDTQVKVILTKEKTLKNLSESKAQIVCLDSNKDIISESKENPPNNTSAENLAYVIYTSGSTGRSKGVMIEHRSVVNLANSLIQNIYANHQTHPLRVSLNAPLVFDASVQQLVMLLYGHALYILPENIRADGKALLNYIKRNKIDVLDCTPAQLKLLNDAGLLNGGEPQPRLILVGGEAIDKKLWQSLKQAEAIEFFNVYGPTECTVDSTFCLISKAGSVPCIGQPMLNTQIYILDSYLQPVSLGVVGELYIGGIGLARGYHNQPELTAEKFISNSFSDEPKTRLYKTGDLGRYLPDGTIEFVGRVDHQIKLRSHRIELGEIEALLGEHAAVKTAVAVLREDIPDDKRIVVYIVPSKGDVPTTSELRRFLEKWLPDYMMPSTFVFLDALPLTLNGKVDRRALPAPDRARPYLEEAFVAPRTLLEKQITDIWSEILDLDRVGVHDNFFDLGGHSLLATEFISQLREALQVEVTQYNLFDRPTVAKLAEHIETVRWAGQKWPTPQSSETSNYMEGEV